MKNKMTKKKKNTANKIPTIHSSNVNLLNPKKLVKLFEVLEVDFHD